MTTNIPLPVNSDRDKPIFKPAISPASDVKNSAVFIFLHGLNDSAEAIENVADQFQRGGKLPHMSWILPNAKYNPQTLDKAWFTILEWLSQHAPSRPELAAAQDEAGMLESVAYIETVLDAVVDAGVPAHRIVLGGFSQGCAMSLLTSLISEKYAGRLGGVVGLLGFLPLWEPGERVKGLRVERGMGESMGEAGGRVSYFLAKGLKDGWIPLRVWKYSVEGLRALGVPEEMVVEKRYEGLTHTLNGAVLSDVCTFLERVVPDLE